MFFILAVLAVIIADTYGKNLASQEGNSTNSTEWIQRHPECKPSFVPEFFKSKSIPETVLICAPGVESTFKSINKKWMENPIWDDGIASEALQEAWKRHSTDADFKYYSTWSWSKAKSNQTTLLQKVKSSMRIEPILERGFLATLRAYHKGELEIVSCNYQKKTSSTFSS
ncbi:hypothetical protein GCK32_013456 [Trichostrongylus colubriformis]|uniref:Uncharacterized protein n=1 Tax=Trichostrongylus colubriformis TaxID=6319 RepID=A0AAN8J2S2_TRICO